MQKLRDIDLILFFIQQIFSIILSTCDSILIFFFTCHLIFNSTVIFNVFHIINILAFKNSNSPLIKDKNTGTGKFAR